MHEEKDFLDEMTEEIAQGDSVELDEWEATKVASLIAKARNSSRRHARSVD